MRYLRRSRLGNRRVAGAGQFRSAPVHRSESPTGYSSAGCSPAEPASASPVTDNSSSIATQRGNQMRCSTSLLGCSPGRVRRAPPPTGVSSLLCTPGDISILRRQDIGVCSTSAKTWPCRFSPPLMRESECGLNISFLRYSVPDIATHRKGQSHPLSRRLGLV